MNGRLPVAMAGCALAAAMLALGCSTVAGPAPLVAMPSQTDEPVPLHVGIMPLAVDGAFERYQRALNELNEQQQARFVYQPTAERRAGWVDEVADVMRQERVFVQVDRFDLPEGASNESPPSEATLAAGWEAGFDVLVRPVLRAHDCYYVGDTEAYVPNLILWMVLFPPTWLVPDVEFGTEMAVALEFYSTATRAKLPSLRRVLRHEPIVHALNDFDQGWNFLNIFTTPSGLSDAQWETIGRQLLPLARRETQRALLRYARAPGPDGLASQLRALVPTVLRKQMAIAVGYNRPPVAGAAGRLGPNYAEEDAARWIDATIGGSAPLYPNPSWMTRTLVGPHATSPALFRAIEDMFVRHLRAGDCATLFLDAPGYVNAQGEPVIVLNDTPNERSGLTIPQLRDQLAKVQGSVVVVALIAWPPGVAARDPFAALTELPNVAVLTPVGGGEAGFDLALTAPDVFFEDALKSHVVVHELRPILADPELLATLDVGGATTGAGTPDGAVSWRELEAHLARRVHDLTASDGLTQTPRLRGASRVLDAPFFVYRAQGVRPASLPPLGETDGPAEPPGPDARPDDASAATPLRPAPRPARGPSGRQGAVTPVVGAGLSR